MQPKASFAERTVTCQDSAPRIRGQTLHWPFLDPTSDSSMHDQAHGLPEFGLLVPADGINGSHSLRSRHSNRAETTYSEELPRLTCCSSAQPWQGTDRI